MTHDPRADELLLAALSFCVSVEECADRAFLCHDAHGLGDRIRAYLDEAEAEYVWKVYFQVERAKQGIREFRNVDDAIAWAGLIPESYQRTERVELS